MKRIWIASLLALVLLLSACSSRDPQNSSSQESSSSQQSSSQAETDSSSSEPEESEEEESQQEAPATAQEFIDVFQTGEGFETVTFAKTMFSMPIEAAGYYSEDSTLTMSIYEYSSQEEVQAQMSAISSTGYSVKTLDGATVQMEWVAPPHFFAGENYIVLYCGTSQDVLDFLQETLGSQFAGAEI